MSSEIWDNLLEEKGFMQVPRALRLKRAELRLTNNKYIILLDYVDYYMYCRSVNPYKHLSEMSGVSERSIRRTLSSIEDKGLLERKVERKPNGRVSGVIFSLDPLVRRLRSLMKKSSPSVGDNSFTLVPNESFTPNTREDLNTRQETRKKKSAKDADVVGGGDSSFTTLKEHSESKIQAASEESGRGRETRGRPTRSGAVIRQGVREIKFKLSRESGGRTALRFPVSNLKKVRGSGSGKTRGARRGVRRDVRRGGGAAHAHGRPRVQVGGNVFRVAINQ